MLEDFNYFKIISEPYSIPSNRNNRGKNDWVADCQCICGKVRRLKLQEIKNKSRKSCGCKRSYKSIDNKKICSRCEKEQEVTHFHKDKSKDGVRNVCKTCIKRNGLKCKYGITLEEYNLILDKQGGVCACCGTTHSNKSKNKNSNYFTIDHCHKTGKVRGLLCFMCNTGIGKLGDTSESLHKAFYYLKKFEESIKIS